MKRFAGKLPSWLATIGLLFGMNVVLASRAVADGLASGLLVTPSCQANMTDIDQDYNAYDLGAVPGSHAHLLQPPSGCTPTQLRSEMALDPRILAVEEDQKLTLKATRYYFAKDGGFTGTINTQAFSQINYSIFSQSFTGKGAVVAVLDTGADLTHPDLVGHFTPGYNFVSDTTDPSDLPDDLSNPAGSPAAGHGTFNAGIIARVAPGALIMPLKVLNGQGTGYLSDVLAAIQWAIANNANVINMSFSTYKHSQLLDAAVSQAKAAGIVVVAAAGNDGSEKLEYPAACPAVLGVASVDQSNLLSTFSNYGNTDVTFVAPGNGIRSAYWDGTYAIGGGTSFAAPFVSGLAALLFSAGSQQIQAVNGLANPASVVQAIQGSANSLDALNPIYAGLLGYGMINCDHAVMLLLGY